MAVTSDGERVVSGSFDKTIRIWDIATGACIRTLTGHTREVRAVALTSDGGRIVSAAEDSTVGIWDADTGVCLRTLRKRGG